MEAPVLVAVMGLLTVVAIYFMWGRKIESKTEAQPAKEAQ